jgi:hypothetical protein
MDTNVPDILVTSNMISYAVFVRRKIPSLLSEKLYGIHHNYQEIN